MLMADHNKPCTLCNTPRPVLIRCQIDETRSWHFLCPGACWRGVSGGEEDARGLENEFPHYRYGGIAKKPKKVKEKQKERRAKREKAASEAHSQSEDEDGDPEDAEVVAGDAAKS
ncbi:hypothetical protein CLAFUW4_07689 [Fulvia fulva]|uniref:Uncharacterized protein n=1 Tax=Passalora fulva TaxID=5499 RepID=A0A9Q8P6L2_PASFU|nr:uncharacterized protein CLAFUR5_07817 [Fulvia fulva]KAK4628741.1 hypothetical protein CLAFUR4_07694 [Fulvia fulva]KAK4630784.1 hypothetical protein CLAFUR0_07692 [Fulvia fulva]UJO15119.1 hypothetical protein CLAFUR5_07817 [Fulvia fulva]WPV12784.1 hypothetical protein CLAFUW4_07689 [Fulvia fulva]WPV27108.1 hypothetical protein CLAFUW7_07690 [Fulvia fulva]